MGNILEIRGLKVFYGVHEAVCGVDMDIAEGSITAIIGSNGAGKSTIINAISGAVKYEGEIFCRGAALPTKENRVVRQGVVQVPEGRKIFPGLTVEENLRAGAYTIRGHKEIERLLQEQYEMFPRLGERRQQDAGTLSGGEQQMLAMARALMSKPRLLMLDEPSMGLAPILVEQIFDIIRALHKSGTTILLVEQNAQMALSVANRAYVLETGKISMSGDAQELLHNDAVRKAYLGA